MTNDFHIIIPARYGSQRLKGKMLLDLAGEAVIYHTYRQALKSNPASIMIATEDPLMVRYFEDKGLPYCLTSATHLTGTDRIAEVVLNGDYDDDAIIVNVQGDEPFMRPSMIKVAVDLLKQDKVAVMSTVCMVIDNMEDFRNPMIVKVVRDTQQRALYFSRSPIPVYRDTPDVLPKAYRHVGLYAYRASFLRQWPSLQPSLLEEIESLEQLRVLEAGERILVGDVPSHALFEINTEADLVRANAMYSHMKTLLE
jgi:3-deoxy-manno-octulosonate cytidylyltransferase (CMP-KDO synthetase)